MNESRFSHLFREAFRKHLPGWSVRNLQQCPSEPCIPDVLVLHKKTRLHVMVELKVLRPGEDKVHFQRGQPQWHEDWLRDGGSVVTLTRAEGSLWLLGGEQSRTYASLKGLRPGAPPALPGLEVFRYEKGWPSHVAQALLRRCGAP